MNTKWIVGGIILVGVAGLGWWLFRPETTEERTQAFVQNNATALTSMALSTTPLILSVSPMNREQPR